MRPILMPCNRPDLMYLRTVLGDIPVLGALFRRRTESDTPRYLLIFVTATIVKDNGEFLVYEDNPLSTNSIAAPK